MRLFLAISLFLLACGQEEKTQYKRVPYKGETPTAGVKDEAWPLVKANCTSCHATQAPIIASKEDMLKHAAAICKVLQAGTMPPSGPLETAKSDKIKAELCG